MTPTSSSFTRRTVLAGGGVALATALLAACTPGRPIDGTAATTSGSTEPTLNPLVFDPGMLAEFDRVIATAFTTYSLVGASVALFQGDAIVYNRGFGVRDLAGGDPVTPTTRFRIGSNTKSMTSLLLASYVDDGLTTWDTRAVDLWPGFVGPTPDLTASLRLHDLLGMGSGIAEPETIEFFAAGGGVGAEGLLRTIPFLEVLDKTAYYYNNTLVAAAPYLVMLADGTDPSGLEERYAKDLAERVFAPIGMLDAAVAADPRPLGPDYAVGYQRDLAQVEVPVPFVSIGGYGPAGSVIASSTDMARYLITQSRRGLAPDGTAVASPENVGRTHQPGIVVPPDSQNGLPSALLVDTTETHYDLGWFDETFTDGERMLWHAGGIDGFGSLMGFLPDRGVGFVALTNVEPSVGGLFNFAVQAAFLDSLLGLNSTVPAVLETVPPAHREKDVATLATTRAVDTAAARPYLGLYSDGFTLSTSGDELVLRHDIRTMRVRAVGSDDYVIVNGPSIVSGQPLSLATDSDGARTMTITGFEPIVWLSGS